MSSGKMARGGQATIIRLPQSWVGITRNHFPMWLKGILPQKKFFRPYLIFKIVMGCGKARFGRKGQKTPKIENFGL